jgi:hypothetical protein
MRSTIPQREGRRVKQTIIGTILLILFAGCERREPLTAARAEQIIRGLMFAVEPVYAEVPQKVWFGPTAPKDDYDEKSIRTLANLEKAGLITVQQSTEGANTVYQAKVTKKGFNILGTMPSLRGPVYRGRICEKHLDAVRNFVPHPADPTIGSAEVVWHYEKPTPLYAMYETKINKPLNHPFASVVSLRWSKGAWRMQTVVGKTEAGTKG